MAFPGNRIFGGKIWEIFRPEHSETSRLSTGIRDWVFPSCFLVSGWEIFGNSRTLSLAGLKFKFRKRTNDVPTWHRIPMLEIVYQHRNFQSLHPQPWWPRCKHCHLQGFGSGGRRGQTPCRWRQWNPHQQWTEIKQRMVLDQFRDCAWWSGYGFGLSYRNLGGKCYNTKMWKTLKTR